MTAADRFLLLAFALANAVLYSCLLPLWEGFDEPFHYGYVQYLSTARRLPVLGQTNLSQEVWDSMRLCPTSHVVARTREGLQTYDRYFALSPDERRAERERLEAIPRAAAVASNQGNYEAHQAPLAYLLLAGPDLVLHRLPITTRILWLRILAAVASAVLTLLGAERLFRALGLPRPFQVLGVFCIFACQMYWATVAHIANDWLALPLSIWLFAGLAEKRAIRTLALATALGLLTKAYFLPLAVFVASRPLLAAAVAAAAAPWYLRNLVIYGSLTATVESVAGVGPRQVMAAVTHVPWGRSIAYMSRAMLWTGNNSFTTFSSATLNCILALLAAGVVMCLVRRRMHRAVLAALAVYACAVVYVTASDYVFRHGESAGASPWYLMVFLAPLLALAFLGMDGVPRFGRPAAIATVLLWTYVCLATYLVKLIPLYGGYPKGRTTLKDTLAWYLHSHGDLTSMLATISLAPPALIYFATAAVACLAIALAVRLVRSA